MPVLVDIAQRLFRGRVPEPPDTTTGVVGVSLCAVTGLRATAACDRQTDGRAAAGVPLRSCPVCGMRATASAVAILRPRPGVYQAADATGIELSLTATGPRTACWFVDGRMVPGGMAPKPQRFARGRHSVRCVGGEGGADAVSFEVR
jgi:hypothetical protein